MVQKRPFKPSVSVIIPVYNEEVVIEKTILSILNSHYPITEILVVDDGSTDDKARLVEQLGQKHKKVRLLKKLNGGKASALNLGFQKAEGEFIITIDADSLLTKEAISCFLQHFRDREVAAVSGNCKIGNTQCFPSGH